MTEWAGFKWSQEFLFHISLVLLTTYALVVFLFRRDDRASLYFAATCFAFQIPSAIFGYDNLLLMAFPSFGFGTMLTMLYLSGIASIVGFLSYARALYPLETPQLWVKTLLAVFAMAALAQVWLLIRQRDTLTASYLYSGIMIVTMLALATMIFIVIRACLRQRDGAVMFLIGMVFFAGMILILALIANGIVPRNAVPGIDLTTYGMLMLLFTHIVILAERWSVAMDEARQTNSDLRSLLDLSSSVVSEMQLAKLLEKIVGVASRIVHAERSSLFLHDPSRDELWSLVAEGDNVDEIRFPAGSGIAGEVFRSGQAVNVDDAYADPRFNRSVDDATGFRTRSILTIPVRARDGRKLGVMQALNRERGSAFDSGDIERMSAFAAQAAISIENATLFSEVVTSRNYSESILRSMSSGVVTFDPQLRVARYNLAARRILRMPGDPETDVETRYSLQANNAALMAEIVALRTSEQAKTFLDIELIAADGTAISANVSVIPLVSEGAEVGILILIEDISEGKRLQGAMRRFMPQKVVDQVLDRPDELLFGSACRASVLFADIRDFTSMTEKLTPRETVDMLNEVFTDLFEAVASTDGILDKYIGDAVMAVYGVPFAAERDAINSVDAAITMVKMIAAINPGRRTRGLSDLRLGVGIATGDVVAGTIGSPKRMDYTVIGDSVNLAARLQDLTKIYGIAIIVCAETAARIAGMHSVRELDYIRVRGREAAERIYEVVGSSGENSPGHHDLAERYAAGRASLARRDWVEAASVFDRLVTDYADGPSRLMLARARAAIGVPPPDDWDGVW